MKIKDGFVLREVAGQAVVIATGEASRDFRGMIKLNGTGKVVWQGLMDGLTEEQIVANITASYEVSPEQAHADVRELLDQMQNAGFLTV